MTRGFAAPHFNAGLISGRLEEYLDGFAIL
jgi:hypothetical protein